MGNNNDRLKVFENIIDEANGDFDDFIKSTKGKQQFNKAIQEKNISYIFMAMIFFGVNLDSDYGVVQLNYNQLLKKNIDKFTEDDLLIIRSGFKREDINVINTFFKKKFKIICDNISENMKLNYEYLFTPNNLGLTPLANAIIEGDADTVKIIIKCYNVSLDSYCYMDKFYNIKDLLHDNSENLIWNNILKFMEKDYDFTKMRQFIFDTLQIKKEFLEIFKLGLLCRFPNHITHKIINDYYDCDTNITQKYNMTKIESDIATLTKFNYTVSNFSSGPNMLEKFMCSVEKLEGFKVFWIWSRFNDDIFINKDIILYIFQKIELRNTQIPLLLIK
jgi:hypothetical protein